MSKLLLLLCLIPVYQMLMNPVLNERFFLREKEVLQLALWLSRGNTVEINQLKHQGAGLLQLLNDLVQSIFELLHIFHVNDVSRKKFLLLAELVLEEILTEIAAESLQFEFEAYNFRFGLSSHNRNIEL